MDGSEFAKHLLDISEEVEQFINDDAPVIMGKTAVDFYKEGFENEGFTDGGLHKWKEVKRRQDSKVKGAWATRKILTGDTGDLGMSIDYKDAADGEVTVFSDKPYAEAHNEGTANAGRSRNVTIPKRQFIGDSQELDQEILSELERKAGEILNK